LKYSKIILPGIGIALHDLNGDIYISYQFLNLKILFFNDILNLSKNVNSNNDLNLEATFTYDAFDIFFNINQQDENNYKTITNQYNVINFVHEDTLKIMEYDTINNENYIHVNI